MSREPKQRTEFVWPDDDVGWLDDHASTRQSSNPSRSWLVSGVGRGGVGRGGGDIESASGPGGVGRGGGGMESASGPGGVGGSGIGGEWRSWLARLKPKLPTPTELADRLGVSVPTVVFGAAGVLAAMAGGWWALRPSPGPDPEVLMPTADVVAIAVPPPETVPPAPIVVHVAGSVAHPGVHELPVGSRVVDAVTAAGGLTAEADVDRMNLAAAVNDGSRLWVPAIGDHDEPEVVSGALGSDGGATGGSGGPGVSGSKVNINTASVDGLQALPGIGPSLAAAIVENRERAGPFARVEDLDRVAGIGPAKLAQLQPLIVV